MNVFKELLKRNLSIRTSNGFIQGTDVFSLKEEHLVKSLKIYAELLKKESSEDILDFVKTKNLKTKEIENLEIVFEVLKEVYLDLQEVKTLEIENKKKQLHNQKIMELISKKEDENLQNLTVEELKKMLQ